MPGQESGILVYGEQRGSAFADYNNDKKVDLIVTQNGARTMLFKNKLSKPGLRRKATRAKEKSFSFRQ